MKNRLATGDRRVKSTRRQKVHALKNRQPGRGTCPPEPSQSHTISESKLQVFLGGHIETYHCGACAFSVSFEDDSDIQKYHTISRNIPMWMDPPIQQILQQPTSHHLINPYQTLHPIHQKLDPTQPGKSIKYAAFLALAQSWPSSYHVRF